MDTRALLILLMAGCSSPPPTGSTQQAFERGAKQASLTVRLWTRPGCPACDNFEERKPTEFYCNGEWVPIDYVYRDGPNPTKKVPAATVNGQTVIGPSNILELIQSEIDAMPCD
jgi:hypothetical protein